ncbi:hypothetical protein [Streptomyces sp. CB03911]|uniref:hypothetical protein n=1 Tax=Streptomyces sp. CB03911 TaxID=1804758 RepID=UPI00093FA15F|nr:hypothetical protein [Streptomyces sp. CB03911]OKI16535.1 hypothetical protein A6A07_11025 [Streptomyces sp. CB03911]
MFGKSKAELRRENDALRETVEEQHRHLRAAGADYALVKRERIEWQQRAERTADDRIADAREMTRLKLLASRLTLELDSLKKKTEAQAELAVTA